MMKHAVRSKFLVALLGSLLVPSFVDPASAQDSSTATADEAAIADYNRKYLKAINDGDIGMLASLTTEDHWVIASGGPGGPPLVGKNSLVDSMARTFQNVDLDESWAVEETVVSGDLAYQRGTFVIVATPKAGGEQSRTTGNFLHVYRKIAGNWFMVRDAWALPDR
jgi:ketosteroid isomerase-like protein